MGSPNSGQGRRLNMRADAAATPRSCTGACLTPTGRDATPSSSRSANAIWAPGRQSPATCDSPASKRPTRVATGSARRCIRLRYRDDSAAELWGGGLFGALALFGRLRLGLGGQLATTSRSRDQLVRRFLLGNEAGLHPEVDRLGMVGDYRHRRLLGHHRIAAREGHADLFQVE